MKECEFKGGELNFIVYLHTKNSYAARMRCVAVKLCIMFYYRRKLLLALIQKFNGEMMTTPLQKLLFLLTRMQKEKSYDFIPYKFGCYSLLANQDLLFLEKSGYLQKDINGHSVKWQLVSNDNFILYLHKEDLSALNSIYTTFSEYNINSLIKHTYLNYPFWAINSTILDDILTNVEKEKVLQQQKNSQDKILFTIGYEGLSLETYINKLIVNDVKVLCDVRKNAYSQKWGFSKSQLKEACEKVNVQYINVPQLGIESEERQELTSLAAYKQLFLSYEKNTLIENWQYLIQVSELLLKYDRVALTCFEKNVQMCHRGVVATNLMSLSELKGYKRKDL